MTLDRTSLLGYLKERWVEHDSMMQALMAKTPLLSMLEQSNKMMPAGGRYMSLPMLRVGSQGRSANYTKAKTNAEGSKTVRFDCEYVSNYHICKIDGNTLDDSEGNENSIAEAVDLEMESGIANMRKDLQHSLFGNTGGYRGIVGAIGTGLAGSNCRITLSNVTDSKFFESGMVLQASANDGSSTAHTLLDSGATITIDSMDRANGYLEFASDVTVAISGLTTNYYLFADGDFQSKWTGIRGWIPDSDPTSGDSHHNVDRTAEILRLSGFRRSITGQALETGIVESMGYAAVYDVDPDIYVVNPVRWSAMANSLGADRANRLTSVSGKAGRAMVSWEAIAVSSEAGIIPVMSDAGCGIDEGLGIRKDSFVIGHVGGALVRVIDNDGQNLRRGDGDTWLLELKHRGQLGCRNPGRNMRNTLASLS